MTLQPQANFTVVRQIADHTDSTTYYVRAVIRNAYTDAIIETLDLTDRGSQRFSKNWQVPADPSGQGFWISIVTSVYTDSGYTTKSQNYGDEEQTYLVADRGTAFGGRGGGGGIDSRTLRRIIQEELEKLEKPEPIDLGAIPKPKEYKMRWDEVLKAIENIPKPEKPAKVDLSPVTKKLDGIGQAIQEKEVTPETDLTPILQRLVEDKEDNNLSAQEVKNLLQALESTVIAAIKPAVQEVINKTNFVTSFITHPTAEGMSKKAAEPKEELPDINQLAQ